MEEEIKNEEVEVETGPIEDVEIVETEETTEEKKSFKFGKAHKLEKENEELKTKIAELEGNVAQLKNQYAKAYADTENMKKRLQNDFDSRMKYRIQSFALDILPVLDNCERALALETTDEAYKKGVEMIYAQLTAALNKEGVEVIECLNQPYDANFEQALMMEVVEGVEPGVVVEVFQKGYKLKDRILRAAMVKVSE